MTPRLEVLAAQAVGNVPKLHQPVVHNRRGEAYTYTGIMSMLTASLLRGPKPVVPTLLFLELVSLLLQLLLHLGLTLLELLLRHALFHQGSAVSSKSAHEFAAFSRQL